MGMRRGGRASKRSAGCLLLLAVLISGCGGPVDQRRGSPQQPTPPGSAGKAADTVRSLLDRVRRVQDRPDVPGYDRDCSPGDACVFGTDWSDDTDPLAAAWDLGAATWSPAERASFANDPDLELIAVSGSANLSKGDSTPASWLPPYKPFRCAYVTAYLEVALAYDLAVTDADVRVIEPVVAARC